MSRRRGQRWACDCLACISVEKDAIDLRENQSYLRHFKKRKCDLCWRLRDRKDLSREDEYYGWVTKSRFFPDEIKRFLKVKFLCDNCISSINHRMVWKFRQCWAKATEETIQLACLMVIRDQLNTEAHHDVWQKQEITRGLKRGTDMSNWSWVTQEAIDDAVRRMTARGNN